MTTMRVVLCAGRNQTTTTSGQPYLTHNYTAFNVRCLVRIRPQTRRRNERRTIVAAGVEITNKYEAAAAAKFTRSPHPNAVLSLDQTFFELGLNC